MRKQRAKHHTRAPFLCQKKLCISKAKKGTAILLSLALIGTGVRGVAAPASKADTDYGLSNPRVEMQTRECIEFGSYWQEDTNGDGVADQKDEKTPVKWQILKQEGDDLFLLADQVLDAKAYNEKYESVTWETSTLRTWMNGEFYDTLFTAEEKKAVKETEVKNEDNPYYETAGGNDTKDHLFLLSLSDILNTGYGFSDDRSYFDQARMAKTTAYAKENGTGSSADGTAWWLRSPGYDPSDASYVNGGGNVRYDGLNVVDSSGGVRPALHINAANAAISSALAKKTTEEVALAKTTWDTVEFGNHNGEKITWRVLSVNGEDAFLLADRILLKKAYYEEYESMTWEKSDLRNWLNSSFLSEAFSTEEQSAIEAVTVKNEDNFYYGTEGGNDTTDKVYLLSLSDIVNKAYGFPTAYWCESSSRIAVPTDSERGAWWWLRSPGDHADDASSVSDDGYVILYGNYVYHSSGGVRPALHLNLSSSVWKKGSEVTSDDKKTAITDSLPSGDEEKETTKPSSEPTDSSSGNDGKETTKPDGEPTGTPAGTAAPAPTKTPEGTSGSAPTPTSVPTATPTPAPAGNTTGTTASEQASNSSGSTTDSVVESTDTDSVKAPAKIKSLKVTNKKAGKTVVSFKAVSGAEGYQLQYAKNKKFTKAKKSKTTKKTTYTIKKLTKKTTYYFRVRAYVKDSSGKKKYGKWSAVKKLKIKK